LLGVADRPVGPMDAASPEGLHREESDHA
jgi:hypothetical protein